jgi:hypothetical protein
MIERIFMAYEAKDEKAKHDGPFTTAAAAESAAFRAGWGWVLVYTHTLNESGKVTDVQKRFYKPLRVRLGTNPCGEINIQAGRMPLNFSVGAALSSSSSMAEMRRKLSTPDVEPLSDEESAFFAQYERQMNGKS